MLLGRRRRVDSLKHKRAIIRPVLARLRRLDVAVAESGDPDRLRRALIAIATVSGDAGPAAAGTGHLRTPGRRRGGAGPAGRPAPGDRPARRMRPGAAVSVLAAASGRTGSPAVRRTEERRHGRHGRARRLAKRIVTIVATELQHQVKDPRLAMVTVTAATVTPDLRDATVFYTVYGDEDEMRRPPRPWPVPPAYCGRAVGQQTGIKFTPTLAFKPDTVPEIARPIDELIAAARAADAEVARARGRRQLRGRRRSLPQPPRRATTSTTTTTAKPTICGAGGCR